MADKREGTTLLELRTLGTLDLRWCGGSTVDSVLAQPKRTALLVHLALARPRGMQQRDTLLAMFWPERDADRARLALRQALHFLRAELGDSVLRARGNGEVGINDREFWSDAVEFDRAVAEHRWEAAAIQYAGELLPGFHIDDAPAFEEWLERERERLRGQAARVAWTLCDQFESAGDTRGALEWARRAAALSPTDETAIRRVMEILVRAGDRAAALRTYETFTEQLAREYDLEPSPPTRQLTEAIRQYDKGNRSVESRGGELPRNTEAAEASAGTHSKSGERPGDTLPAGAVRRSSRAILILTAVVLLLASWATMHRRLSQPDRVNSNGSPAAVAILPFAVNERNSAAWREDLVTLLAANIDGSAGFRVIHTRAVLARLREAGHIDNDDAISQANEVARRSGARYALHGSIVAVGSKVRVIVEVVDAVRGDRLEQLQRDGPADSLPVLVDQLAIDALRAMLNREGRRVDLSGIDGAHSMTRSLPAVRAYLEAERLQRRADYQAAARAYMRAFELDTMFVLALVPFVYPGSFVSQMAPLETKEVLARIANARQPLPRRAELIVKSASAFEAGRRQAGYDYLRQASLEFPDDPNLWYTRGEIALHDGSDLLLDRGEAVHAFAAAVAIDSSFHPAYHHLIERTLLYRADRELASRLVQAYVKTGAAREPGNVAPLAFTLAFGSATERRRAVAVLDTLPLEFVAEVSSFLGHPSFRDTYDRVGDVITKRSAEPRADLYVPRVYASRGQFSHITGRTWPDYNCPAVLIYLAHMIGLQRLPTAARELLSLAHAQNARECRGTITFLSGAYAADLGNWADYDSAVAQLQYKADTLRTTGDSANEMQFRSWIVALQSYHLMSQGRTAEAISGLQRAQRGLIGETNQIIRWRLGLTLLSNDRPREARPYFASMWHSSVRLDLLASYYLARIDEALGNFSEAQAEYASFARAWRNADADFQPMVRHAASAANRLSRLPATAGKK